LKRVGFCLENLSAHAAQELFIEQQDSLARRCQDFMFTCFSTRVRSLLQPAYFLPQAFAGLLQPDPSLQEVALRRARRWYVGLTAAAGCNLPLVQQSLRKSCFKWVLTQEIFEELVRADFQQVPEDLQRYLEQLFANFGGTTFVETSFQRARRCEAERPDRHVDAVKNWLACTKGRVLPTFRYDEVNAEDVLEEPRPGFASFPKTFFKPQYSQCSVTNAKDMIGTGPPKWPHWSPDGAVGMVEEMERLCLLQGELEKVGLSEKKKTAISSVARLWGWSLLSHLRHCSHPTPEAGVPLCCWGGGAGAGRGHGWGAAGVAVMDVATPDPWHDRLVRQALPPRR
jgi:hypothetical protein